MLETAVRSVAVTRDALIDLPEPYSPGSVEAIVKSLRPTREELHPYVQFSPTGYTRTLFYRGPRFEILVLSWRDGQRSPLHDHAASICCMAVVDGICTTESFRLADGRSAGAVAPGELVTLAGDQEQRYGAGEVLTAVGGDIHRVGNAQGDGTDLITVHFYLPPIPSMRCFDEQTGCCCIQEATTLSPRH